MSFAVPYIVFPGSTVPTATPGQATTLPHAFTAGTVYDPALAAWNMDTARGIVARSRLHLRFLMFFPVSQHMWHHRLGHPESDVLRRLVSNNFISCIKEKPPILCHACQLAHVRLPFWRGVLVITHWLKEMGKSCDVAGSFGGKWVLAATILLKSGKEPASYVIQRSNETDYTSYRNPKAYGSAIVPRCSYCHK
nr:ribonuclease H-like domain-containing protein [Tanacetum cinerariifolium]